MTDSDDSGSEQSSNYDEDYDRFRNIDGIVAILPYMFEPQVEREVMDDGEATSSSDEDDLEEEEDNRLDNLFWCQCGLCVLMPTQRESLCCREMWGHLVDKLNFEEHGIHCISDHKDFESVCLNPAVLRVSLLMMCQYYQNPVPDDPAPNR